LLPERTLRGSVAVSLGAGLLVLVLVSVLLAAGRVLSAREDLEGSALSLVLLSDAAGWDFFSSLLPVVRVLLALLCAFIPIAMSSMTVMVRIFFMTSWF
jgi:hypothetical protein